MSKKILIIDDDAGIIDVLTIILTDEGFDVRSVDDDSLVFETIDEFKPDLILLDVWMPGMGGKEICHKLKSKSETRKIPVMFVSASVNIEQISNDCQADGYISKPFEISELLEKVNHKVNV